MCEKKHFWKKNWKNACFSIKNISCLNIAANLKVKVYRNTQIFVFVIGQKGALNLVNLAQMTNSCTGSFA